MHIQKKFLNLNQIAYLEVVIEYKYHLVSNSKKVKWKISLFKVLEKFSKSHCHKCLSEQDIKDLILDPSWTTFVVDHKKIFLVLAKTWMVDA